MEQPPNPGPAWAPPQGPPRRRNGPSPFMWVLIVVSGLITIFVALRLLAFGTADAPKKETVDHGRFAKVPNGCAALTGEDVAAVLPGAAAKPTGGDASYSLCEWDATGRGGRSRGSLEVGLTRYDGDGGTPADGKAHEWFASQARPAPPSDGFVGKQEAVPGLGDEATLVGSVGKVVDGRPVFDCTLYVRVGNLVAKLVYRPLVYGRDGSLDEFASQDRERPGVLDTGTHLAAHLSAM